MTLRTALSQDEIESRLRDLPDWQYKDNALERVYDGESYLQALDKLVAIARLSEAADHHPDLSLIWKKLTVRYWTHTAQGVTELDFQLARKAGQLLEP
jgi:4a-hydroxytetrahydrobiopterin dehydratase